MTTKPLARAPRLSTLLATLATGVLLAFVVGCPGDMSEDAGAADAGDDDAGS